MKFGVVNKSLTVNRFLVHTLQRSIKHLAVITRKTNIKLGSLKGGTGKEPQLGMMNKLIIVSRFARLTQHRNIKHLAIITREIVI